MSTHASAPTTGGHITDTETRKFVLDKYLADQALTERLAFPDSAMAPHAKAQDIAEWVDEWQAAWERFAKD